MNPSSFSRSGTSDMSTMLRFTWTTPSLPVGTPSLTGYEVQYRVDGETEWSDHVFDSDGATTETTITGMKSNTAYYARVRAVNADGEGPWSAEFWAMTDIAELTVGFSTTAYSVSEGATATTTVNVTPSADRGVTVTITKTGDGVTLSGLDPKGNLTIVRGQSSGSITISGDQDNDAVDDRITLTLSAEDYKYSLIRVSTSTATVIVVDDEGANNPPVVATTSPISVPENQKSVATLQATDPDGDSITGWSIASGADGALFSVTNGGVLSFVTAPDYESPSDTGGDNGYQLAVTASDGTDNSDPVTITVNVTDIDEPPGAPTNLAVSPNAENSTTTLDTSWTAPATSGIPPISGYDVQYRAGSSGSWTPHDFQSTGTTTSTTIGGLTSNTTYQVQVRAKNDEGQGPWSTSASTTDKVLLTVGFSTTTYSVAEGATTTATVNVTPSADRDVTVTITKTGDGATLSGLDSKGNLTISRGLSSANFTISGDQDNDAVDDEVTLTLNTTDGGVNIGSPSTSTVTIIDDEEPNSAPVVATTTPISVPENQKSVATLQATDPDGDSITGWSIAAGTDGALFSLTNGGVLSFVTAPDYESPSDTGGDNGYELAVTASDGTDASPPMTVTLNVTDVDEPPPSMNQPGFSASGASDTTSMLILKWVAPTLPVGTPGITGYEAQYRAQGETDWTVHDFKSTATTTETTITGLFSNTYYDAQVRAVNVEGEGPWSPTSGAKTAEALLTVGFSATAYSVAEGATATATVSVTPSADRDVTVTITKAGDGATLTGLDSKGNLTIVRGLSSGNFTISGDQDNDAANGEVTLTLNTTDGGVNIGSPSTSTVTIIDDEEPNSAPVVATTSPISVPENQTSVATLQATDPDGDEITGWSIASGTDGALFSLTNGGVLSFVTAPDYESPSDTGGDNGYELSVTASDGADASSPVTITVNVTDVNEPPPAMNQPGFSASGTSDTTSMLILKWVAPVLPVGTPGITGYEAQYRAQGETDWTVHDFKSTATTTETTITGLASNTYYDAQVRAVNVEGEGQWSKTSSAKTAEALLTVGFSTTTYSVAEGATATATVSVTPSADRDVTVTITKTGDGATLSGLDSKGNLTISRGLSSANFTISGDQDNDALDDEVTLTLNTTDGGVSVGSPSTSTITIIDDEEPNSAPVVATTTPISVPENQKSVATLQATDPDGDSITGWSIAAGTDGALFSVTNGGVLSFVTAPDYESPSDTGGDNGYELAVTASDGTDNSAPVTITVNVTDVNEPPGAPTDLAVSPNTENSTTTLDASWTAPAASGIPPISGYDVQYRAGSSGDWTTHDSQSNGTTTSATIGGLTSNTTYQVQVRARNDEGRSPWATSTSTTDKVLLTVGFSTTTYSVAEGATTTATVNVTPSADRDVTLTITKTGDGATLSGLDSNGNLTIVRGQSSGNFTVSGDQDNDAADDRITLTLNTTDGGVSVGSPSTSTITIIDDEEPNSAPVVATTTPISVPENQKSVATLQATDPDGDSITGWSIAAGTDGALFSVTNGGVLSFVTAPDYESPSDTGGDNGYELAVTASDGTDNSAPVTITVNVTDVNEPPGAPTDLAVSPNTENSTTTLDASWTAPATSGIPPISGYDVQYRAGSSGDWTTHDSQSNGTTTSATIGGLTSNTTYQVQVRARNDEGRSPWATSTSTTDKVLLTVGFSTTTYSVAEGATTTATVNVTPSADRDVTLTITKTGDGATLSGLDSNGNLTIVRGQSSGNFTVSGDQDNDAADDRITLTLSTNDGGVSVGNPSTSTVTIIDDEEPNNAPVVATTSPISVPENQTSVATLQATDPDGDSITGWSIAAGTDGALFSVTNGGVLSFVTAPDYESPSDTGGDNGYELAVTASDGADASAPVTITVNVTDVDEPPGAPTNLSVSPNAENSTTTLDASWTAPDASGIPPISGYDVRYRAGSSGRWTPHDFQSNGTTTKTTIGGLTSNTTYQVQVRARNDEGRSPWATSTSTTDKVLLTVGFSATNYSVTEGATTTATVNVTPSADRDVTVTITKTGDGATLTGLDSKGNLTISRGLSSGSFTISGDQDNDAANDEVTLTLNTNDGGVSVGSPSTSTVTILDDEEPNSPPVVATTSPISVPENQTSVATLQATDPDGDEITGWSITTGADGALFSLTNGGVLSFVTAPDYESPSDTGGDNGYELSVTASDGKDASAPVTITVNVTDIDEPPPAMNQPGFSASGASDTTSMLKLKWVAPTLPVGTPSVTGYEVQYKAQNETDWIAHDFASTATTTDTTIAGLSSNTYYDAQVRAVNVEGEGPWSPMSGAKTAEALLTVGFSATTYSVAEGATATATVSVTPSADRDVTLTVTKTGDGATLSGLDSKGNLTISRGLSSGSFTISGDQDNDATDDRVTLTLSTNDGGVSVGSPSTSTVIIIDDDEPNNAPVVATTTPISVPENQTSVATLQATDPDGDAITGWSIATGTDGALFSLTNGGVLSFVTAPDHESPSDTGGDNGYELSVTASDGKDASAPVTITVNVTDVNEPPGAPTDLAVSPNTENSTTTLDASWTAPAESGIPPISGYDVQYRAGSSGDWTTHDSQSNGTATSTTIGGLTSNTTYQVQVRAKNDEGRGPWTTSTSTTDKVLLTVGFSATAYSVAEGATATATVNVTPSADRDVTVTITKTGDGATLSGLDSNGNLTISRGQSSGSITISGDQDNDAANDEVTLTLNTNDGGVSVGSPSTSTVTILDDEEPNSPPVVATTSPISVPENQTSVATLQATDPDGDAITGWSIASGADGALFSVTNGGVLSFVTAPDYESPSDTGGDNGYELAVTASDGTDNSAPVTITVNVTDIDEPPPSMKQPGFSASGASDMTSMLILKWVAPVLPVGAPSVTGYEAQYRAQSETDWIIHDFASTATTTETTITGLSSNTYYGAQVRAVNVEGEGPWSPTSGAKTAEALLTVGFSATAYSVAEGATTTATVNVTPSADRDVTVTITKAGDGATLTGLDSKGNLTIVRGLSSGSFTISGDHDNDATNGKIMLTLSTTDGGVNVGNPSTSTVTVMDDETPNLPPAFASTTVNRTIPEDSPVGALLGNPIAATDPEGDPLTYSLSGEGSERFEVSSLGQVTLISGLNYEDASSFTLTLSVRDSKDNVGNPDSETDASVTLNVTVSDVAEPPGSVAPVTVSALSTSELLARWPIAQNTGPPLKYQVQYRAHGETDWIDLNFDDDARETTISNLDSSATYRVRVRANNDEGEGPWAEGSGATDKMPLTVRFSAVAYSVAEGATATATVNVTPSADRDVTLTITKTGNGATLSGLDSNGDLTISRGLSFVSFTISGDQDNDAADDEVTLTLDTNDDGVNAGSPSTSTVTVIDDDEANPVSDVDEPPASPGDVTVSTNADNQATTSNVKWTAPQFDSRRITLKVNENSAEGSPVGSPVIVKEQAPDADVAYSLLGADASAFRVDRESGQITVAAKLDYETKRAYSIIVFATDREGSSADIAITIEVNNVDEPGAITLSSNEPETGKIVTAILSDPDGSVSDTAWQWQTSSDGTVWIDVEGASSPDYAPTPGDEDKLLRVTAAYADAHGPGKMAESPATLPVLPSPDPDAMALASTTPEAGASDIVRPDPTPTASPTPQPMPTPEPTLPPTRTPTPPPTSTPTPEPTPTPPPTSTPTPEPTPAPPPTFTPTPAHTLPPAPAPTSEPTLSPTPTPTQTPKPTPARRPAASPTPTPIPAPTITPTPEPEGILAPTPIKILTLAIPVTHTPLPSAAPASEPTPTPTATPTPAGADANIEESGFPLWTMAVIAIVAIVLAGGVFFSSRLRLAKIHHQVAGCP